MDKGLDTVDDMRTIWDNLRIELAGNRTAAMTARFFDDFRLGEVFETERRTVSEAEIVRFAEEFDPQAFHTDPIIAKNSRFNGLVASGMHTLSLSMGQFFRSGVLIEANLGSPGIDELRWLLPLRPGDSLRQRFEVTELTPSKSKPDRGLVRMRHDTLNQRDELIMQFSCMHIAKRRPSAVAQNRLP